MADEKVCDNCHWLSLRDEERLLRIQDLEAERDSLAAQVAVLREALRGMLEFTAGMEEYYGPFPGGDPRRFTPDHVNCSAKELQAWEAACAEWDAGEGDDRGPSCLAFGDGSSQSGTGFGVGVYRYDVPEIQNARAALARYDGEGEPTP